MKLFKNILKHDAKKDLLPPDSVYLGDKIIRVRKITFEVLEQITEVLERIPYLLIKLATSQDEEFHQYLVGAMSIASDEIVKVVAILSGLEADYIKKEVGVNEIFDYLRKVMDKNDLSKTVKNVISLLQAKSQTEQTAESEQ